MWKTQQCYNQGLCGNLFTKKVESKKSHDKDPFTFWIVQCYLDTYTVLTVVRTVLWTSKRANWRSTFFASYREIPPRVHISISEYLPYYDMPGPCIVLRLFLPSRAQSRNFFIFFAMRVLTGNEKRDRDVVLSANFFKLLRSPGIDSKGLTPPAFVAYSL